MSFFIHYCEHSNSCCESNMQIKMRNDENIYVLTVCIYQKMPCDEGLYEKNVLCSVMAYK